MDAGDAMFVVAAIVAMTIFAVTLFTVTWLTNGREIGLRYFFSPMRGSSPARRRRMFSRWVTKISAASTAAPSGVEPRAEQQHIKRRRGGCDESRERRDAPDEGGGDPGGEDDEGDGQD